MATASIVAFLSPLIVNASVVAHTKDMTLTVGQSVIRVMAGSAYDSTDMKDGTLVVSVPVGEAFEMRTFESLVALENDAFQPTCNILPERTNQLILNGPIVATIRPSTIACGASTASSNSTPMLSISAPAQGSLIKAGDSKSIFWSNSGSIVASVRIRLSLDGGVTYTTTIADGIPNTGYYGWNVPMTIFSTSLARIKIEGKESGLVRAMALGPIFTIDGLPSPATATPPTQGNMLVQPYDYEVAEELSTAATIGADKSLKYSSAVVCNPETRIKGKGSDSVYYCGRDGKRYVFPNKKTHDTWYADFNGVVEIELTDLQKIPLGGNVTYRPGSRLVKIQTAPEVFAVAANGELRHVSESAAIRLYGANWNTKVDDIPDAFFANYVIGAPVNE